MIRKERVFERQYAGDAAIRTVSNQNKETLFRGFMYKKDATFFLGDALDIDGILTLVHVRSHKGVRHNVVNILHAYASTDIQAGNPSIFFRVLGVDA